MISSPNLIVGDDLLDSDEDDLGNSSSFGTRSITDTKRFGVELDVDGSGLGVFDRLRLTFFGVIPNDELDADP